MSLLLDALKKAAEKKAKKSEVRAEDVDTTDVVIGDHTQAVSPQHDAELTETLAHEPDATSMGQDTTLFIDETEVESAHVDETHVDETRLDETHIDETHVDETHSDKTHIDETHVGETTIDKAEFITPLNSNPDSVDQAERLMEEDRSLLILDDDEDSDEHPAAVDTGAAEAADSETQALHDEPDEKPLEELTEDDVTQFMGDGYTKADLARSQLKADTGRASDDTTLTNPESLTLTDFAYGDALIENQDDQRSTQTDKDLTDTHSLHDYEGGAIPAQPTTESLSLNDLLKDGNSTFVNEDSRITDSGIDIATLTNDETVTVESSASTKTFAPDNYDRTLLNMSDKDVSRIFPGMRPDSDAVMTPDYAKKVFLSRSSQVKTHYYKIYAAVGLLLLLVVVLWGLFQLQGESEMIDQSMISLKRDPMPGVIKPNTGATTQRLFESAPVESDTRAIDIIAKADQSLLGTSDKAVEVERTARPQEIEEDDKASRDKAIAGDNVEHPSPVLPKDAKPAGKTEAAPASKIDRAQRSASTSLQISSSSRIDEKDQLLVDAYKAYEAGDIKSAKALYDRVLLLDDSNRDAILGRAAIHIQDNEYQQAINKYQQLLVINPKDSMALTSLISVANIDPHIGETQLKVLLREQPELSYLHSALGNMYGSQNRWSEAQNAYFVALQHEPDDPNYAYNLAVSLEHLGKTQSAIGYYQRALDNMGKGLAIFDSNLVNGRLEVLGQ